MITEVTLLVAALLLGILYVLLALKRPVIAMATAPILCVVFIYGASLTEDPALTIQVLLLVPIVLLAAFVPVLLVRGIPAKERSFWGCVKWLLVRLAAVLILLTAFLAAFAVLTPEFMFLVLFICVVAFGGAAINYGLTSRHTIATYVISTIGSSMRQNLPLAMALESAAGAGDDKRSRILRNISKWLVLGHSVSTSIKVGYPKCPSYALAMITAAEPINQLPQAIKSIEADMAARSDRSSRIQPVGAFYPMILLLWLGFVVWGIMVYVMPSFYHVLTELIPDAQLPAATKTLVRIAEFIGWNHPAFFMIVLALLILVVFPLWMYVRFRQRRPQEPYLMSRIGDYLKWRLPMLHWFEKNYSTVQTTGMLRLSLNAGATVNDAIANTIGLDINNCFRKRLTIWLERVEAGANVSVAANDAGVGRGIAWAFDETVNQGNTLTVLETTESFHRSDYSYRVNLAKFVMGPCVTLAMATVVGFVVYAIYSVPVTIIYYTAEMIYP